MSFFVKACIVALKELPAINAEIDGDELIYKNYYIGVALAPNRASLCRCCAMPMQSFAEVEKGIPIWA